MSGRHRFEPGPVPYFTCPCGVTIGFKRDQPAFSFVNAFDLEPDPYFLPRAVLEVAEAAVEKHEVERHGLAA